MQLIVIGSNSGGNGYLLKAADQTLLIECGMPLTAVKQALNFNLNNLSAIVTHSHGDHAKHLPGVIKAGIPVYASEHTLSASNMLQHHRANIITSGKSYKIGGYTIKPFNVHHDVPTFGFLIHHIECGLTLFLTDTYYTDYVFPGLNNIIVECNHSTEIIAAEKAFLRNRIVQSHMNLETCKELLKANNLTLVNNIVLIHLSDRNSDEQKFKSEISALTGKHVTIAEAGLIIPFNKTPI